jgi:hypothetical protein
MSRLHVVVTSLRLLRASFTRNAPPPPQKKDAKPMPLLYVYVSYRQQQGGGAKKRRGPCSAISIVGVGVQCCVLCRPCSRW